MADGFLSGLTRRAAHWREEAEDRAETHGRAGWRRARRGGEDAAAELRRLWSQIEDIMEREVAPAASVGARRTAAAASDYAHSASETASDYARRARRAVAEYGPQAREVAEHAALSVRDTARAHPLLAAGLLVGATWLVASMLSGPRRR